MTFSANDSRCFPDFRENFTAEAYEAFKLEIQEDYTEFYSFNLPWLKLTVCVLGMTTNFFNIVVLTRPFVSSSINILFASLETVNLLIYTTVFFEFAIYYNKDNGILFSDTLSLINYISVCAYFFLICTSNWLTVTIGVWRFIAITYPFKAPIYCNRFRSKLVVGIICLLSLALWSFYFFSSECLLHEYDIINEDGDVMYQISVRLTGSWRMDEIWPFYKTFFPVAILVSYAVPCTTLAVVSICLICRLWKVRIERMAIRKDRSTDSATSNSTGGNQLTLAMAAMILMYLLVFLALLNESIISVMYFFFSESYIQTLFMTRLAVSRSSIILCNSLAIFFYCITSEKLRHTYKQILLAFICKAPKSICGYSNNNSHSASNHRNVEFTPVLSLSYVQTT